MGKLLKRITSFASLLYLMTTPAVSISHQPNEEAVILLHGLNRSSAHMGRLYHTLSNAGYDVYNIDYPSTKYPIEVLIKQTHDQLDSLGLEKYEKIHFVGYSMGGLIARGIIAQYRPANLGRVVQISSPNHGSEIVDFWKDNPLFKWIFGAAGQQLTTDFDYLQLLGGVDYELGVIAGNRTIDPISSRLFSGENDGRVSVESTRTQGMTDHIVIPATHAFITKNHITQRQVLAFLSTGKFNHLDEASDQ